MPNLNDIKSQITFELWDKFKDYPSTSKDDLHKRDTEMITYLIELLAIERAKNE